MSKQNSPEKDNLKVENKAQSRSDLSPLTEINSSFQARSQNEGFDLAQAQANQALASSDIKLNQRFVLEEVIGHGGMGTVYKAKDLRRVEAQDSHPYIAVKVLNSDFREHPDAFISLQREASRSYLLSHPNIVNVHDFDRDGAAIFMTMELLNGEGLDELLKKHRKSGVGVEQTLRILTEFCAALSYAHQKGIVHSDLKPGNIFISDNGVKVLDFGIARLAEKSGLKDHFDAGSLGALTPTYASLEMLEKQSPDARDDIFAAGIIAYELLCGKHPYGGKSAAAALALGLEPPKLEQLSNRQWTALSRALKLKREERTASIDEFLKGMTERFQFPLFKVSSAVLLLMVGGLVLSSYFLPDELTQVIEQTMKKAQVCFQKQDYPCAISSANAIIKMAPENKPAITLLADAEFRLRQQQQAVLVSQLESTIEHCLRAQDFSCVKQKADELKALVPESEKASDWFNLAESSLLQAEVFERQKQQQLAVALENAKSCFEAGDNDCAKAQATIVLDIDPGNSQAETVLQNVDYALKQKQQNLERANRVLTDGQDCMRKLNYSCAIAKSESALEFVPGHRGALKLKRDAEKAIERAKKTIKIE